MVQVNKLWTGFLPQWVVVNTVGWVLYAFVQALPFGYIGFSIGVGLLISSFQWIVLKKYMRVDAMWVWVSTLVYGVYIFSLGVLVNESYGRLLAIIVVVLGLMGLLQRFVLDHYINQSILWILISCAAGIIGFVFTLLFEDTFLFEGSLPIVWAMYGMVYGLITGIALASLYANAINKKIPQ